MLQNDYIISQLTMQCNFDIQSVLIIFSAQKNNYGVYQKPYLQWNGIVIAYVLWHITPLLFARKNVYVNYLNRNNWIGNINIFPSTKIFHYEFIICTLKYKNMCPSFFHANNLYYRTNMFCCIEIIYLTQIELVQN